MLLLNARMKLLDQKQLHDVLMKGSTPESIYIAPKTFHSVLHPDKVLSCS